MIMCFASLLFIVMIPLSTFSQDGCITDPPGAIDCGEWISHIETFNLSVYDPIYGACEITAVYQSRVCTVVEGQCTSRVEQFRLGSIEWNWDELPHEPCYHFTQFLMPGYPDDFVFNTNNFNIVYGDLMNSIHDYHFMQYMATLTPLEQYALKCDGVDPNCQIPACQPYQAYLNKGKCQDICITFDGLKIKAKLETCNSIPPVCCSYNSKYCPCFDEMGLFRGFVKTRTVDTDPGGCGGNGSQYLNCIQSTYESYYVPCTAFCPIQE
jgi:hypothetical protein